MLNMWQTSCEKAKVNTGIVVLLQIACEEVNTDTLLASSTPDMSFIDVCHLWIDAVVKTTAHQDEWQVLG